jgi:hypothetical protein
MIELPTVEKCDNKKCPGYNVRYKCNCKIKKKGGSCATYVEFKENDEI